MSDIVIKVENLYKEYRLGTINHGTLTQDMQSWWARMRGKEDPNSILTPHHSPSKPSSPLTFDLSPPPDRFLALNDVSFEVKQGEAVGIIGRNGAGKSTLLKILSSVTTPTSGAVKIRGRVASLLEVGTGFHPELTGRENVFLNGAILGMSKSEIRTKFDEIVAFAEIEKFIDTPVKRYSSGMYVRLAFAVAAHLEPEILIVDEVLAVGDAQFQKKCLGKMEEVGLQGRTVLFVSHNMGAINRFCSTCLLLDRGQLISSGMTEKVIRDYLASNMANSSTYELPHAGAKEMQLRRVVLNPGNKEQTGEVRYDEPIVIRVEYEVNSPVNNCTVWLALQTMEGVIAFCTTDYDMDPNMLGNRIPGYYKTDILIPEKWLNVGEYNVIIGVIRNNPVAVFHREETLTFSVVEVGTPGSIIKEGIRKGVLQPFLKWTRVDR